MSDPNLALQALLTAGANASPFAPGSRYYGVPTGTYELPDGRVILYVRRRFIPPPEQHPLVEEHEVHQADRPDNLAAHYLGDPTAFWRLCDANAVIRRSPI